MNTSRITIFTILFLLLIGSMHFVSCNKENIGQQLPNREWELVWADEFDETKITKPNSKNWSYDIGNGVNGWGNSEGQYYTDRLDVVYQDGNGNLNIVAKKENLGGMQYISGRIKTQSKISQKYGKIEARIKTPLGPGIWPAFWMLGSNIDSLSWPKCGEIDIMELKGQYPATNYGSLHGPGYSAGNSINSSYSLKTGNFATDFHLFSVEWYEDRVDFFVDNFLYQRIEKSEVEKKGKWVFDQPFFILLNVAVGGNFVGFVNDKTSFPQTMQVDYVRVYNLKK